MLHSVAHREENLGSETIAPLLWNLRTMREKVLLLFVAAYTLFSGSSISSAAESPEAIILADRLVTRFIQEHERP